MAKCVSKKTIQHPLKNLTVTITEYECDNCHKELPCDIIWEEDGNVEKIKSGFEKWVYCPYCGAKL